MKGKRVCAFCGKRCATVQGKTAHERHLHKAEMKAKRDTEKKASREAETSRPKRRYSRRRRKPCDYCGKKIKRGGLMTRHLMTVHPDTPDGSVVKSRQEALNAHKNGFPKFCPHCGHDIAELVTIRASFCAWCGNGIKSLFVKTEPVGTTD